MCGTCGCSEAVMAPMAETEARAHRMVTLEQDLLAKNDATAVHNRQWLRERRVLAVNLMSSPGSGKTTLLERTVRELGVAASVVEGDQETELDAARIRATGASVVQINTGSGCHLDAEMLHRGLGELVPPPESVLFVENVGNLVCPALFDLGEGCRTVVMSVTEGADKPLKYPHMFSRSDVVVLNKVDLSPYVDFQMGPFLDALRRVRPGVEVLPLSATTGEGVEAWYAWLRHRLAHLVSEPVTV